MREAYTFDVAGSSPARPTMIKKKRLEDKILVIGGSPLDDNWWSNEADDEFAQKVEDMADDGETMMVSGEMGLGDRHPVTILIIDEITGAEIEMTHVKNALVVVEDERKSTSGWLSMVIGDVDKLGEVLRFIARATVNELKRLVKGK